MIVVGFCNLLKEVHFREKLILAFHLLREFLLLVLLIFKSGLHLLEIPLDLLGVPLDVFGPLGRSF